MNRILTIFIIAVSAGFLGFDSGEQIKSADSNESTTENFVNDLLSKMTLEEKIGQMNMPCVYETPLGDDIPSKTEACRKLAEGTFIEDIGPFGGFFTLANTILQEGTLQQAINS